MIGIRFAPDGGNLRDDGAEYDSTRKHILIDPKANPKHMDILTMSGGSAFAGDNVQREETLFSIEHELPFIPKCMVYFYVTDAPALHVASIGQYIGDDFPMSGTGAFTDVIYYTVDQTHFKIKHQHQSQGGSGASQANQWQFRIKYMITNNSRYYARNDYLDP